MTLVKKILTGAALCTAALLVPAAVATPASASASASASMSGPVSIAANSCGLPTSARPPSRFIRSWSDCNTCIREAYKRSNPTLGIRYYCTYNPSNNLNDLHLYLG
ncbi:hypothetical protein AB0F88_12290 [Streptosporangium sp. NPDC023963]|uniref:hypothetical protein n=1 Tax=unclassified Streptosporangium TaxID=2632669 RepID=UPI003424D5E0